ncbi:MAG: hypothetical protein KKE51_07865 [Gammaproteobacteria bacterium]|nr:hypothetical protein [Gammaproteobacteria bacterium]MBU1602306.1 hypothetical protein [Gammaproteobacteria bacterium]MBU2433112.1 hypothetical protein [Gammaproteobacteria bacterium]MBU2451026.1 hypothetical protein [Gammaproteobacteria bacterium]
MRAEAISQSALISAAQAAAEIQLAYATNGTSLAQAALAGAHHCEEFRHYPANDASDPVARTRFYYHAHTSQRYPRDEHGHFHLFHYGDSGKGDDFCHLIGLSLDARGNALRWFTTNRWVTGERWLTAAQMEAILADYRILVRGRLAPVARWLTAMVTLFASDISDAMQERDQIMSEKILRIGDEAAFEDRNLDVITERPVSLPARLCELQG